MKPCLNLGGWDSRSTFTTSGYENHSGMSLPVRRRERSSVPEMLRVRTPEGTSSSGLYSSLSGR